MKHLTIIFLTFLTLFFISCNGDEPETTDLCKSVTCEEWQECNKASGNCDTKENFCSTNGECTGFNIYCDTENHICKEHDKCTDVECKTWEECNLDDGSCKLKENSCNEDGDCLGENKYCDLTEHTCLTIVTPCDNVDCGEHGSCLVKEGNTTECVCEEGYFIKEGQTKCIEFSCENTTSVGHTEASATDIKTLEEDRKYDYYYKHNVCEGSQDVFYFSDSSALLKIYTHYDSDFDMKFYRNSISEENIINYQYEMIDDFNSSDDYEFSSYKLISIDNPNNDKIYLIIKSRLPEFNYYRSRYHIKYVSACSNDEYNSPACPNAMICENNICNNYCEDYNDCPSQFDCNNNKCEISSCDTHLDCNLDVMRGTRRLCLENKCITQSVSCNNNSDCTILNTENNNFICASNTCQLEEPSINFGETKLIDLMYKRAFNYKFRIPSPENGKGNFTITLDGLNVLNEFEITIKSVLENDNEVNDIEKLYIDKNFFINTSNITLNVAHFINVINIEVTITITFNAYTSDTPPLISLNISENNINGCQSNDECEDITGYYRICDLETHSCIRPNIEEIIAGSLKEENCFYDEDCIGDDLACERGICTKTCDGYPPCGENQYCSDLDKTYSDHYCLAKCYSDLECKTYEANFYARCNLENNECY